MIDEARQEPEVLGAVFTLLAMFAGVVVAESLLLLLMGAMYRQKWPGRQSVETLFLYGPFITMLYPGARQLICRRWMTGVVFVVAGLLLAWSALFLVGLAAWVMQ